MRLKSRKTTSKKKIEEIDDADSNRGGLQYRCTLQGIHTLFKEVKFKLKKGHHDAFEKTPFKLLFKALHDDEIIKEKKKDEMLDDLILCYDKNAKQFKFGSEFHKPTRLDVKLIFGIEDGTEDVGKITHHRRGESKLQARHFANDFRVTVKKLKDKIKELVENEDQESIEDAVKLLCVIILHNVLFPNTGAYIAWGFLYYVDDFDRLRSYDWSQHVLDELMNGLHDEWSNPKQVNGCILLLPYWFCEHLDNVPDMHKNGTVKELMITGGQGISSNGIPRLTKWKLKNLDQLIEISVLYKMDTKLFNNNELIPTFAEEYLIKSLNGKRKVKKVVIEQDLGLELPPADDEILMDVMPRKSKRVKRVTKEKEESSGDSAEGDQESEATQVDKDIESYELPEDNSEGKSYADELMIRGFDMSENVEEPRNSSKGKSLAEPRKVCDQDKLKKNKESGKTVTVLGKRKERLTNVNIKEKSVRNSSKVKSIAEARKVHVQDKPKKKKELGKTVTVIGKRKKRLTKVNVTEKNGLRKDDKMKKLEEENSRLKGIVDSLKREKMNLIGKQETMAAEHFEMEIALDEEVSKKTKLLCELENEKLARKELLNELAWAKIKIEQKVDKAKDNESMVQNLQPCIQNRPHNSAGQNFSQGLIQQQEVDRTMFESLVDRVAAEHFEMEMVVDEEITKKTELLCELESEKLARKNLLNEQTLAKIKNDQHEDKAKENESVVQNLQTYIQNLVQASGSQNFGQESTQQQEVDRTMIELLGERVSAEHFEMEMALGEESTKITELVSELEMEKLARKNLLNELTLVKVKNDQHEDKAKENESVVPNLQTYIQNLLQGSGSQNFGQESIQQLEVDKTMIESLGERVARLEKGMHEKDIAINNLEAMAPDHEGSI